MLRSRLAVVSAKKDNPTSNPRHRWQECLCTDLQSVGGPTSQKGRSVTLMTTLPALLAGTPAVDVIFPGGGVPPVRKVAVTRAPAVTLGPPAPASPATRSFDLNNQQGGWQAEDWPTLAGSSASRSSVAAPPSPWRRTTPSRTAA